MKTLMDLKQGENGIILKINGQGTLKRRIVDMGLTPGTSICVKRFAPMGDPLEIEIRGYRLSIRKSEASQIEVTQIKDSPNLKIDFFQKTKPNTVILTSNDSENKILKVALIGNPNSGKTTLFNELTGSYQYVGNWPGVTVKRKEGKLKNSKNKVEIVDLPGIYSLSPYSPEEIITRNYILNENPALILNIIDSTNLERNLYLTTQLLELDYKVIVALNMADIFKKKGKEINIKSFSKDLGIPVVPISASKNTGINTLISEIFKNLQSAQRTRKLFNTYEDNVEAALENIDKEINGSKAVLHSRFKSVKILENDPAIFSELKLSNKINDKLKKIRNEIFKSNDKEIAIADARYNFIYKICKKNIKEKEQASKKSSFSHKIDKFVTGKFTAIPIFLCLVALIFYITFGPFGIYLKLLFENFIQGPMTYYITQVLDVLKASDWAKDLVLSVLVQGFGSVISFLPQVIILFTLLSLLEDCGYMARAVFIMDRIFRRIGLSGKAFVPLIMGFGCSVPAILGTRILENKKDKNLAIFLIPFMSCTAKMPIYMLFASLFFPKYQTIVVLSLYAFGLALAIFTALIFKDTLFKGDTTPFVMEIPEYKWPSAKNLWNQVWDRTKDFIERAGTVILGASIIIWFLQTFTLELKFTTDSSGSILANIGGLIAPIFKICGFGTWQAVVSLLTGFMAKETIVSTLSVIHGSAGSLTDALSQAFSPLSALSFLVFVLLYTPCVAAVSAASKELGDKKLFFISIIYQLFIAFLFSALVYQTGSLFIKILG